MNDTRLLDTHEAAELLHVHYFTLARWRTEGVGPDFVRVGARNVRYRPSDIAAWLDAQTVKGG